MKRYRRCDTTKYRRRRERDKIAHKEHVERRRKEEVAAAAARKRELDAYLKLKADFHHQEQALVNVLARRLYQLNPEYAEAAREREAIRTIHSIWKLFSPLSV